MPEEKPPTFNPNIPRVTGLNSYVLEKEGWVRMGSTYTKDQNTLVYDGVHWFLNGQRVSYLHETKQ
jgi:hypothetical protein